MTTFYDDLMSIAQPAIDLEIEFNNKLHIYIENSNLKHPGKFVINDTTLYKQYTTIIDICNIIHKQNYIKKNTPLHVLKDLVLDLCYLDETVERLLTDYNIHNTYIKTIRYRYLKTNKSKVKDTFETLCLIGDTIVRLREELDIDVPLNEFISLEAIVRKLSNSSIFVYKQLLTNII